MSTSLETLSITQLNIRKVFLEEQLCFVIQALHNLQGKEKDKKREIEPISINSKKIKIKKIKNPEMKNLKNNNNYCDQ